MVINRLIYEICVKRGIDSVKNPRQITYWRVRTVLQETGYSHFFENIVKIIGILTGRPSRTLKLHQRRELIKRFNEIQKPFDRVKGKRRNFMSYSYVTYKLVELLGYTEFMPFLPLLKAPQNLLAADRLWKKVCDACRYQYIPTDPDRGNLLVCDLPPVLEDLDANDTNDANDADDANDANDDGVDEKTENARD